MGKIEKKIGGVIVEEIVDNTQQNSVEITHNSRGISHKIKVYNDNPDKMATELNAYEQVVKAHIEKWINEREGYGGKCDTC